MNRFIKRFAANESGATAIEYGLIVALIGLGLVAVAGPVGDGIANVFGKAQGALDAA